MEGLRRRPKGTKQGALSDTSRFEGWTEKTALELRQNVSEADGIEVYRDEGCLVGGGGGGGCGGGVN